jgi:PKD repeat protein
MTYPIRHDDAVSEGIGTILLIAIVVTGVAIAAAFLWSQPTAQKVPEFSASISNSSCNITLVHTGGDTVENTTILFLVDGADQTVNFIKQGSAGSWASWGIGETLVYTPSMCIRPPQRVEIIYRYGNSASIITTGYFENPLSANFTPRLPPSPVIASFSGTPTSGTVPLTVQFTDTSSGTPLAWNWTFGDGGLSSSQNPSYTYQNVNTYSVSLTVSNGTANSTLIRTNYITTYTPPIANFTGTPLTGGAPLSVTFTDSSTGSPTTWNWTFGDIGGVNTSTSQSPSHTYTTAGTYSVNLTVSNAGGSNTLIRNNYITVAATPVADFSGTPLSGTAPLSVTFTDTSSNTPTSWKWEYRNATTGWTQFSTTQNPTFSFPAGTYSINLTATNAGGSGNKTSNNYITVTPSSCGAGAYGVWGVFGSGWNRTNGVCTVAMWNTSQTTPWTVPAGVYSVEYLVIAGGGGGGGCTGDGVGAGGGGAGGYKNGTHAVTPGAGLTVTVGAGGAGGAAGPNSGSNGSVSVFGSNTSTGGGGGAGSSGSGVAGNAGGSGGGGVEGGAGGAGTTGQGYNGGGSVGSTYAGGGGGGAGAVGTAGSSSGSGNGGNGLVFTITGDSLYYAGGGGGGMGDTHTVGAGGLGGGGAGGALNANNGVNATFYGSGGGGATSVTTGQSRRGGYGYWGVVIIRYFTP